LRMDAARKTGSGELRGQCKRFETGKAETGARANGSAVVPRTRQKNSKKACPGRDGVPWRPGNQIGPTEWKGVLPTRVGGKPGGAMWSLRAQGDIDAVAVTCSQTTTTHRLPTASKHVASPHPLPTH